ncbi:uncharacterized protein LOC129610081 isoform X1 [Condylostylus longicornis]|uniref:uncharacterized protein LOC129610081 isoform X1 n=1 Tax=Condylostylus longicornis TaxID=2530218 RepID=UPI00244DD48E|nr:uncharacterized protein LOC129610081 isoform X1 [Condylostylus longicornis]
MQKYQNLPNLNLITRNRASHYRGGCFGTSNKDDLKRSEIFAKALQEATQLALSGKRLEDGTLEKPLTTNFELLNLVPDDSNSNGNGGINNVGSVSNSGNGNNINLMFGDDIDPILTKITKRPENQLAKWRRVGIVSGTNVQLDTIVWPGGDVVVSGLSARARTTFRIVTALAPPFVMESEMDEDGLCLRGLPCHRLSPNSDHNLTLMFNAIETMYRLKEDAVEHGVKPPDGIDDDNYDHNLYNTKCCYGLSMDLLDNIATELGFEFHLYIVRDELFGTKYNNLNDFFPPTDKKINHRIINDDENIQTDAKAFKQQQQQQYQQQQKDHYTNRIHYPPPDSRNFQSGSFERNKNLNQNYNKDEDDVIVEDEDDYEDNINRANKDERKYDKQDIRRENYFDAIKGFQNGYRRSKLKVHWNGIVGDLISGSADMSFAPLTISKARAEVIDFSAPYFYSGVTLLAAPQSKSEIPLLAFLLPFSPELWIAIFTSLNVTAIAVAIYEWLSPFGLNPWGRQRSKNFSMSSALWVMWGLLCGHLVAFKAPKSWPNKFLINVWGGFSVIFIASYTANIAALIAGLFFHNASNRRSGELLEQRIGAPTASAAESFMKEYHHHMWEHMKKFPLKNIEEGIKGLKNGTLDLLLGDTAILDYYRATDHKCSLQKVGEPYIEDAYAIGMKKGFPLKDSISALIAKYSSNGYLDILTEKWYGGLPCYQLDNDIVMPRPLGVEAVAGVFLLLGLGVILGVLILIFEHLFFKYTLPLLRLKPKGSVWRSRNIMFFSQKLYRFINCVELVSPHHAARELVHTLRQGQIASLFQKSIKREDEQRRRRRSKAQFFEMIQEIRRVQQAEKMKPKLEVVSECTETTETALNPEIPEIIEPSLSPKVSPKPRLSLSPKPRSSPMQKLFRNNNTRSRSNSSTLNVRRFSTDSILSERLDTIGRRLSRDLTNSPPDFGKRYEVLANKMSTSNISGSSGGVSDTYKKYDTMGKKHFSDEKLEETKFNSLNTKNNISEKNISATIPSKKHQLRRTPLNSDTFSPQIGKSISTSTSKDELMKKDSNTTSSTGSISKKNKSELPVDLLQPSIGNDDKIKTKIIQRSKENLLSKNSNDSISCTDETEQSSQQQPLYTSIKIVEKRPVHRSSSSQTCSIGYRSSRPTKRSNQNLHHRQRSLDNLDSRPPMPLPIEATSVSRPQSRDKIDYNKDDNNINDNNDDDDDDDDDDIRTIYIRQTDINLPLKISPLRRNLNDSNEFKKISLDRLSREDLLKLSETSQTEIHEYLSKPKPTDYTDKPP